MTETDRSATAGELPAPVSQIQLTYRHQESWSLRDEEEPEFWYVSADVVDDERGDRVGHVGDFTFVRIDPRETGDVFGLLDAWSGDLGAVGQALTDPGTGGWRADLDGYTASLDTGMLILDCAQLVDEWRGFGIGTLLAGRAIRRLRPGNRGVACYPASLDPAHHQSGPRGPQVDAARKAAKVKLRTVWEGLGFADYRDSVFVLDPRGVAFETALRRLAERAERLPQPDADGWPPHRATAGG